MNIVLFSKLVPKTALTGVVALPFAGLEFAKALHAVLYEDFALNVLTKPVIR